MKKLLIPVLGCLMVLVLSSPTQAQKQSLGWNAVCDYQKSAVLDPIGGANHLHDFGGARVRADSDYYSLRADNANNCTIVDDESGYWTPTLYEEDGTKVLPRFFNVYYRVAPGVDPMEVKAWPVGMEVVAGFSMTPGPQDNVQWACGGGGEGKQALADLPYDCTDSDFPYVTMQIRFGDCSNGQPTSPDGRSHLVNSGDGVCPSTHSRHVPRISLQIPYNTPNGEGAYLSSSMTEETYGMHADWMDGWSNEKVRALIVECIRQGEGCGSDGIRG